MSYNDPFGEKKKKSTGYGYPSSGYQRWSWNRMKLREQGRQPSYDQGTMNALQANIAKKKAAEEQRQHGWQQPIPFQEYHEVVEQQKGMLNTYDGYNISGKPSTGPNGIFEHDHGHMKSDGEGNVRYYRDDKGNDIVKG